MSNIVANPMMLKGKKDNYKSLRKIQNHSKFKFCKRTKKLKFVVLLSSPKN